jgi:hypothetical protein
VLAAVGLLLVLIVVGGIAAYFLLRKSPSSQANASTGSVPPQNARITVAEAKQFNDALVNANKRLENAGRDFGLAVGPAVAGNEVNLFQVRRTYNQLVQTLNEVKADMRALKVPPSQSARAFYDAHQRALAGQEQMVQNDLGEIVRLVEDPRMNKAARAQRIQEIMQRSTKREQEDLEPLRTAQREFAREYNLLLLP